MGFFLTPVVRNLLLINIIIFILQSFANVNFFEIFGLRYLLSPKFAPYQIITHMFIHGSTGHLISNMIGLFIFGPLLEYTWGGRRFLVFYFVCGIGASVLYSSARFYDVYELKRDTDSYITHPTPNKFVNFVSNYAPEFYHSRYDFLNAFEEKPEDPTYLAQSKELVQQIYDIAINIPMGGASGALFGIMMAFAMLFPNREIMSPMTFFIPVQAKYLIGVYAVIEIFAGLNPTAGDSVAHFAHIGGMLFAYIWIAYGKG
jgi:membrane associated rhomboid family serine protease